MDHDGARRLMVEGAEGRLSASDERELALHLVGCTDCKALYEGLQHAQPALAKIGIGPPPTTVVDAAVRRATTVLRGEADPGPVTTSHAASAPPSPPEWSRDTGPLIAEDAVSTEERSASAPIVPQAEPLVEASIAEPSAPSPPPRPPRTAPPPPATEPSPHSPPLPPLPEAPVVPAPSVYPAPVSADVPLARPARPYMPSIRSTAPAGLPPRPPSVEPSLPAPAQPTRISSAPVPYQVSRADEVEALLDEDYGSEPIVVARPPRERKQVGAGPWLAAIAVTVALAILAAVLITRGQGILGTGPALPTAAQVQSQVARVFGNMKSLKASFSVRKLSIYRTGGQQGSLVYSFANGEHTGRFVFDRAEGYRQEVTLAVNGREVDRAKVVQTNGETKVLGTANELIVEKQPPLGPPDGKLRPSFGMLEESIGAAVQVLVASDDLEIVGSTKRDERELYEVRTSVTPNELTRADQMDVFVDARTYFPTIIRRSISRTNAGVLGPGDVLTDDAISRAFGDRERITTELVELDNVVPDDIILPGDFVLDVPGGSTTQTRDSRFERVTRAQVGGKLKFKPLFPRSMREGFREQLIAVYTGEQRGWGPGGRYPAPDGVMHASYFDGKTTIVVTERNIPTGPVAVEGSPLQGTGLPITVRPFERAEKRFFYGVSPEVAPHAYGFLGNVFAMVSGYAPAEELIDVLASLGEAPTTAPAPDVTTSPGAASSPAASTTAPVGTLPGEEP